jgi:DNA-binding winged helix-turn-helix (wHTH) protein
MVHLSKNSTQSNSTLDRGATKTAHSKEDEPMVNQEYAMLILQDDAGQGRHWSLNRPEMYIGRQEDCDIVLDDRKVSRQHARVVRDARGYTLTDLNSKNGTFVNGEPLSEEHRLEDGDEVQIAVSFRLTFVDAGATVPLFFDQISRRGLSLDREAREVYVNQTALSPALSPAQFRLIELLYDNQDRIVERDEVVSTVWPDSAGEGVSEQAIDALVRRLRERLAEIDSEWQFIVTVRGHGFRLDLP